MKNFAFGLATGIFAVLTGIYGSILIGNYESIATSVPSGLVTGVDSKVYPVDILDLISNPDRYDGKIVRVKATYTIAVNSNFGDFLYDPGFIRVVCVSERSDCSRMFPNKTLKYGETTMEVKVIGRFRSNTNDPSPLQRGDTVRLLEISHVVSVKPTSESVGTVDPYYNRCYDDGYDANRNDDYDLPSCGGGG